MIKLVATTALLAIGDLFHPSKRDNMDALTGANRIIVGNKMYYATEPMANKTASNSGDGLLKWLQENKFIKTQKKK